jgi:hypothetical protein
MSSLKNVAILVLVNTLLTMVCIMTIYFLGSFDRDFKLPESILDGLSIFFIIAQLYITFKILKARAIYSGTIYTICIVRIVAIWISFFLYFIHGMQS